MSADIELKQQLKGVIIEELMLQESPEEISNDTPLFGEGLGLDSVDALQLVVGLEKHFVLLCSFFFLLQHSYLWSGPDVRPRICCVGSKKYLYGLIPSGWRFQISSSNSGRPCFRSDFTIFSISLSEIKGP